MTLVLSETGLRILAALLVVFAIFALYTKGKVVDMRGALIALLATAIAGGLIYGLIGQIGLIVKGTVYTLASLILGLIILAIAIVVVPPRSGHHLAVCIFVAVMLFFLLGIVFGHVSGSFSF